MRARGSRRPLGLVLREDAPDADGDQVDRADELDGGERVCRRGDQRGQADGRGHDVHEAARRDAQGGEEARAPPLVDALRDDVRDCRAGNDGERNRREHEEPERGGIRDHGTAR